MEERWKPSRSALDRRIDPKVRGDKGEAVQRDLTYENPREDCWYVGVAAGSEKREGGKEGDASDVRDEDGMTAHAGALSGDRPLNGGI